MEDQAANVVCTHLVFFLSFSFLLLLLLLVRCLWQPRTRDCITAGGKRSWVVRESKPRPGQWWQGIQAITNHAERRRHTVRHIAYQLRSHRRLERIVVLAMLENQPLTPYLHIIYRRRALKIHQWPNFTLILHSY